MEDSSDSDQGMSRAINFDLCLPDYFELSSTDDELLCTIDLEELATSSVPTEQHQLDQMSQQPELQELPIQETLSISEQEPIAKRFKSVTADDLQRLFDARQAPATKKNTAWGMKIFQDWNKEKTGREINMAEIEVMSLANILCKFYCEASPKATAKDIETIYQKNTLINIRAAINRHLANIHRNIDIVRDKEFKMANGVLDGLLKERTKTGLLRQTKHKQIIEKNDLIKISTYLKNAFSSPIILRQCVWYHLSINFVSRGMEFQQQLKINSFEFHNDISGEYVTMKHEANEKSHQDGLSNVENTSVKRMYATGMDDCPVRMLKLLMEKTDKSATSLFNQYNKESLISPQQTNTWFTSKPLSKRSFSRFLYDICQACNVEAHYTPHCLRVTAIQHHYEASHSMYMLNDEGESSQCPLYR